MSSQITPQVVFLNIYQALSGKAPIPGEFPREEYDRHLCSQVARNSHGRISHITVEFAGPRAKYFCCMTFDGSGDYGTGISMFAMPKIRLNVSQKAIIQLSLIEYLIKVGELDANFQVYKARIMEELLTVKNREGAEMAPRAVSTYDIITYNSHKFWYSTAWNGPEQSDRPPYTPLDIPFLDVRTLHNAN